MDSSLLQEAATVIAQSKYLVAFTGAGISVESGIPPFRGPTGLWSQYDPDILNLSRFIRTPEDSWPVIKEIFYDFYGEAKPNPAHYALAELESLGLLKSVVTQNIDGFHQDAGNSEVFEFHGTLRTLRCVECKNQFHYTSKLLDPLPANCPECQGLLKPDFVFFGEGIPLDAGRNSQVAMQTADVVLLIGTLGEVMPASMLPLIAKQNGAILIDVNIEPSNYVNQGVVDIFLQGKAGKILPELITTIKSLIK